MRVPFSGGASRPSDADVRVRRTIVLLALCTALLLDPVEQTRALDMVGGVAIEDAAPEVSAAAPDVPLKAGVVVAPDGRELWSRDPDTRRAMASTTKIMTAVVVLENARLDDLVTVSPGATAVGESASGLSAGDTITVDKMLEALLVKSGNDASVVLAEHVAGSVDAFVELMNAKAEQLGLNDTRYQNPHGLDETNHFTSAHDLGVLARYAMGIEEFRRIVALPETIVTGRKGDQVLESSNLLLGEFAGANGIKTGWTNKAGYCLVASAERGGVELIAVVLGSRNEDSRFDEAADLLEWGFSHYGYQTLASAEETLGAVAVSDYLDVSVGAVLADDVSAPVFDLDGDIARAVALAPLVSAPVKQGDRIGTLTLTQGDRLLAQVPVVAATDVAEPGMFERVWIAVVRAWRALFGEPVPA